MTRSFWRLYCKHQTESTSCAVAFNANLEHENFVFVASDTYVRSIARCADDSEDK